MNIVVTERDKKLLRLVACLAIIVIFGVYLIRPAMEEHETLQSEYDTAEQTQQEYQTQINTLATIDDIIAQNEAALNTASEKYYKGDMETRQMDDIITGIALENGLFQQSLTLTEAAPGAVSAFRAGAGGRIRTDGQQRGYLERYEICGYIVLRCRFFRFLEPDRWYGAGNPGAAGKLRLHRHRDHFGTGCRNPVAEFPR